MGSQRGGALRDFGAPCEQSRRSTAVASFEIVWAAGAVEPFVISRLRESRVNDPQLEMMSTQRYGLAEVGGLAHILRRVCVRCIPDGTRSLGANVCEQQLEGDDA